MTNLKNYLKQLLEAEPKFKEENVQNVLTKIEEKQQVKFAWIPQVIAVTVIATAIAALLFLKPATQPPIISSEEGSEVMLTSFTNYINGYVAQKEQSIIIYSLENYQMENQTLVISKSPMLDTFLVSVHINEDTNWRLFVEQEVKYEDQLYISTSAPYLYTGIIERDAVRAVVLGEEQLPIIRFDDVTIEGVMFVGMADTSTLPLVVDYASSPAERLFTETTTFHHQIELVEPSNGALFINTTPNMHVYADEYSKLPLVVKERPTTIKKYDVVLIHDGKNEPYISRVMSLPESEIAIQNGTIVENNQAMHTFLGTIKLNGYTNLYSFLNQSNLLTKEEEFAKQIFNYSMDATQLSATQYFVVPDNLAQSLPTIVESNDIVGVIQGYDAQSMAAVWSDEEKAIYNQLKEAKSKEQLEQLAPINVARLFLYAKYLADPYMEHFFLTTNPNMEQMSLDQYVTENKGVTTIRHMEWHYTLAKLTENATFEINGIGGTIVLEENTYNNSDLKMIYNENGYWEMAYEFIQQK